MDDAAPRTGKAGRQGGRGKETRHCLAVLVFVCTYFGCVYVSVCVHVCLCEWVCVCVALFFFGGRGLKCARVGVRVYACVCMCVCMRL